MVAEVCVTRYALVNENFEPVPRELPSPSVAVAEIVPSPLSVTETLTTLVPPSTETPLGESSVAASAIVYSYVLPASAMV